MRDILTPEQVADYLQLTRDTVYRLIRSGELPATRIGRTYRIPRRDLEAYLITNSTRPDLREGLFRRVRAIAERNPDLDGDQLLAELEAADEESGERATPKLRSHHA